MKWRTTRKRKEHQLVEENEPVTLAKLIPKSGWQELLRNIFSVMALSEAIEINNSTKITDDVLNRLIVNLKTR